jgi:rhodanese-related sulfurtransferase
MNHRVFRQDLAWAGYIFLIAAALGLLQHWSLVRVAFQGDLAGHLEQARTQRREARFQGVPTLNLAQAYDLHRQGQARFIDARKPEEFDELHIEGAMNIPAEDWDKTGPAAVQDIPRDQTLVVYCGQASCDAALKVAEKLQALGYSHVLVYMAGFRAWDEAGYPVGTRK